LEAYASQRNLMLWVIYPLSDLFYLVSLWCSFCVVVYVIFGALLSFIFTHISFFVSLFALFSFPGWLATWLAVRSCSVFSFSFVVFLSVSHFL
jgi:hypothetical protein